MTNTIQFLLASGIIVTAISGVINIIIGFSSNRTLQKIEKNKLENELLKYRYTEIHECLSEISMLELPNYDLFDEKKTQKTIKEATDYFRRFEKFYMRVIPLLDLSISSSLKTLYEDCRNKENNLTSALYEKKESSVLLGELIMQRQLFQNTLITTLQTQLAHLLSIEVNQ